MPLSLYEITIPVFIRQLKTLSYLLEKGSSHVSDDSTLVNARLIADMGTLAFQIQRLSDTSKGCVVRLTKSAPVPMEDNETTMAQLHERIQKTIAVLEKVDPASMDGMEDKEIVLRGDEKTLGATFVLEYAIPNFYFHFNMAYALLRKEGVPVGKKDYLTGKAS